MKRLFNHTRRPQQEWEGYDESEYDWDSVEEDAYYADEENIEEEGYYAEEEAVGEEGYYAEEEAVGEEGYYAEEEAVEEGYYAEEEAVGEEGYYAEEEAVGEEDYYAEGNAYYVGGRTEKRDGAKREKKDILTWFAGMTAMDRLIALTGVAVLVLFLITGGALISARIVDKQVSDFVNVGRQLEDIGTIGEKGLLAVADAQLARIAASSVVEDNEVHYEEEAYEKEITVVLAMTSIQKDLKIKFTSQKTGKLVANVPFAVTVTEPGGSSSIWSDDDMDGIIYKKDITPGTYRVAMEALSDEKYKDYIISTEAKPVEVRKEIAYQKVDVANEVKAENQVNAAKEDTKKNETVVESALQDTVAWVESKVISANYDEISKSSIPNPLTLVLNKSFMRMTGGGTDGSGGAGTEPTATPEAEPTSAPVETPTPEPAQTPTPEPVETPTPEPAETPTAAPAQTPTAAPTQSPTAVPTATPEPTKSPTVAPTATPAPTASPTAAPTATPTPTASPVAALAKGSISVDKSSVTVSAKKTATVQATVSGFTAGKELLYTAGSANTRIATVAVDTAGKLTITGVADGETKITVTADYRNPVAGQSTAATATISVKVANKSVSLDKTSLTVFITEPQTINATVGNADAGEPTVTAESSDSNVAKVSVDKLAVTIEGVNAGSCIVTVKFTENGEEVTAACAVTVKNHPKNDTTTRLKDAGGNLLYINDNGTYKEATYADYFKYDRFYVKGATKYSGWQTLSGKVYYFTADGNKVTGEQVIQGAKYNFASDGSLVVGSGTNGIDVSKWNGTVDWNAVKNSGISYAIIRCGYRGSSQGSLIEDPKYEANIKGATAAGLKVGVYFFTQAVDEREAVEEASMVLELVKNYRISYPIFLDVEASGGRADSISRETRTAVCEAFCKTIQSEGYVAGIYANKTWLETKLDAGALSAYKIWLAQYAATPTYTGRYDLWQYRSNGSVTGISGGVDLNISYLGY